MILNILNIFLVSLILHFCIFYSLNIGIVGKSFKNRFSNLFSNNKFLFFLVPYFVSLLIFIILNYNIIYLDNKDVIVTAIIDKAEVELTGQFFNQVLENVGTAAVFATGARIAAVLVAKQPIGLLPKLGVIGSTGSGFSISYKMINNNIPSTNSANMSIPTGHLKFKVELSSLKNELTNDKLNSVLNKLLRMLRLFGNSNSLKDLKNNGYSLINTEKYIEVKGTLNQTSKILDEVEKLEPNWDNNLINSSLEKGDLLNIPFKDEIIHNLSLNLTLHYVMIYLMFMLFVIITSKVIIDNNIQFDNIKSYPLGKYIHYFLIKYITMWGKRANLWIYLILFSLFFFTCVSTYSISLILSVL